MERSVCVLTALCLLVCSHGLELTLDLERPPVAGTRDVCGLLTCHERVKASVPSTPDNGQGSPGVVFNNISNMDIFKRVSTRSGVNGQDVREVLIGSVTSQAPSLTRVANGRKVDGLLESGRATVRVELVKQEDCRAEFTCQVRGVDTQGREVMSSASLVQQPSQGKSQVDDRRFMPVTSIQLLTALQQLITQMQKDLNDRLDVLENRLEDKIDHNNNLKKLLELDFKVSTELSKFRSEASSDFIAILDNMKQNMYAEQTQALQNMSETFERTLTNTSDLLTSVETDFDGFKRYSEKNMLDVKNNTEVLLEKLVSGLVSSRCLEEDNADSNCKHSLPITCERNMGGDVNKTYPHYVMTTQFTIQRQVLCDTQTDSGGWTVIQRRTKGDVFFKRDWESYKNGFGNLEIGGDFWLGNEVVHILTYVQPHELRVELRSGGRDYVAHYKTFKLESESDKYRIRLGAVTSSIDGGRHGLSYSNGMPFSTFDRDNDQSSGSCAISYKSGWWYKNCEYSKLNAPWKDQQVKDAWYNGSKLMHATRTEMKIRPVKSN